MHTITVCVDSERILKWGITHLGWWFQSLTSWPFVSGPPRRQNIYGTRRWWKKDALLMTARKQREIASTVYWAFSQRLLFYLGPRIMGWYHLLWNSKVLSYPTLGILSERYLWCFSYLMGFPIQPIWPSTSKLILWLQNESKIISQHVRQKWG